MSPEEPQKKPLQYGDKVVLAATSAPGGSRRSEHAPAFLAVLFLIGFLLIAVSPGGGQGPSVQGRAVATATRLPLIGTSVPGRTLSGLVATPTQFVIIAPGGTAVSCMAGVAVGATVEVAADAVRLRRTPGFTGKDNATDTITFLTRGTRGTVISGPVLADGLCWWLVEFNGLQGWVADRDLDGTVLVVDP